MGYISAFLVAAGLFLPAPMHSQQSVANQTVWQWSVTTPAEKKEFGHARAFLWIPPTCRHIQAVIIAQDNMEERSILEDPGFREQLAGMNVAEIWISPFFDHVFRFDQGAGATFDEILGNLASTSGYTELRVASVVPIWPLGRCELALLFCGLDA